MPGGVAAYGPAQPVGTLEAAPIVECNHCKPSVGRCSAGLRAVSIQSDIDTATVGDGFLRPVGQRVAGINQCGTLCIVGPSYSGDIPPGRTEQMVVAGTDIGKSGFHRQAVKVLTEIPLPACQRLEYFRNR